MIHEIKKIKGEYMKQFIIALLADLTVLLVYFIVKYFMKIFK